MATIILFHSVLGLRQVEQSLAGDWRGDGHQVILPDLYDGKTAETYDGGFAILRAIGVDALSDRARAAAKAVAGPVVLAGISLGGAMAARVWAEREDVSGVLFLAGPGEWPASTGAVPVQMHATRPDPFDEESVFEDWEAANPGARLAMFRYDGAGHLFMDPALPDYSALADQACRARCRDFLAAL